MARPRGSVTRAGAPTKASAIRAYLDQYPKAKTSEIVAALAEKGTQVSPNHVYIIKSKGRRRRRRQAAEAAAGAARQVGITSPVAAVQRVKRLAEELGGLRNLKQLVDVLSE